MGHLLPLTVHDSRIDMSECDLCCIWFTRKVIVITSTVVGGGLAASLGLGIAMTILSFQKPEVKIYCQTTTDYSFAIPWECVGNFVAFSSLFGLYVGYKGARMIVN